MGYVELERIKKDEIDISGQRVREIKMFGEKYIITLGNGDTNDFLILVNDYQIIDLRK